MRDLSAHGTKNRYDAYSCRCPDCRAANAQHSAKRRARRKEAPRAEYLVRHGTITAYFDDRCHCDKCKEARRIYQRSRRARERE